jgi:hypothetical protein
MPNVSIEDIIAKVLAKIIMYEYIHANTKATEQELFEVLNGVVNTRLDADADSSVKLEDVRKMAEVV